MLRNTTADSLSASSYRTVPWIAGISLAIIGCGGESFSRHQISGNVTFQGQGVEYGTIIFEPDASIGKLAPTSYARIENGAFQTAAKESPTKGKYKVRVMGFDKSKMKTDVEPGEIVDTPELFPEHVLNVEIPPSQRAARY